MSSGALGGASQRMPNQANGYSRKYCRRRESGKVCSTDAAGPVGPDEVVAANLVCLAVLVDELHGRAVARDVRDGDLPDPEPHVAAIALAGIREVDEHVGLGVELN